MPYTAPWDENQPTGQEPANTIHTIVQQLKRDLRERLDSLLPSWTSDPVTGVPRCKVRMASSQLIPTATPTALNFDSLDISYPDPPMWSSTTPSKITVQSHARPTTSGPWLVGATVLFDSSGNSVIRRRVALRLNGTTYVANRESYSTDYASVEVTTLLYLSQGDYLEVVVEHNLGASLSVIPGAPADGPSTYVWAVQIT